jgi:hypothetical protein
MSWLRKVPEEVAALAAESGGRALAWAATEPAGWLVATQQRFICPTVEVDVPWQEVLGASWEPPVLEVKLWRPAAAATEQITLPDAGVLPQVVRERIEASLVIQQHVTISGSKGARFLARRDPLTDDVTWQTVLDPGLRADDPMVRARIDDALATLRDAYGV